MIPRGILHAVSVAPDPLQNILPDPGQAVERARSPQDNQKPPVDRPDKRDDFANRLDREIERRERPQEEQEQNRAEPKEGERTEGSSLERKANESDAVLSREEQEPFRNIKDIKKGETATEVPGAKLEEANLEFEPRIFTLRHLVAAVEEWIAKNLELIDTGTLRVESGPGGRAGLNEDQLGPRFAIEAPTASQIKSGIFDATKLILAADISTPKDVVGDSTIGTNSTKGPAVVPSNNAVPAQNSAPIPIEPDHAFSEEVSRVQVQVPAIPNVETEDPITGRMNRARSASTASPVKVQRQGEIAANDSTRPWWKVDNQVLKNEGTRVVRSDDSMLNGIEIVRGRGVDVISRIAELINRAERMFDQKIDISRPFVSVEGQSIADARVPFIVNLLNSATNVSISDKAPVVVKPEGMLFVEDIQKTVQDFGRESLTSIRIRLHPPELGQLVVEFRRDENGLRIEFHTTNPAVQKLLAEAGPKLIERLFNAGVDVGSLDVFVGHGNPGEQRTFSPLDNPDNPPNPANIPGDDGTDVTGIDTDSGQILYWPDESSTIDLMM